MNLLILYDPHVERKKFVNVLFGNVFPVKYQKFAVQVGGVTGPGNTECLGRAPPWSIKLEFPLVIH
jgi:hypothetical protein